MIAATELYTQNPYRNDRFNSTTQKQSADVMSPTNNYQTAGQIRNNIVDRSIKLQRADILRKVENQLNKEAQNQVHEKRQLNFYTPISQATCNKEVRGVNRYQAQTPMHTKIKLSNDPLLLPEPFNQTSFKLSPANRELLNKTICVQDIVKTKDVNRVMSPKKKSSAKLPLLPRSCISPMSTSLPMEIAQINADIVDQNHQLTPFSPDMKSRHSKIEYPRHKSVCADQKASFRNIYLSPIKASHPIAETTQVSALGCIEEMHGTKERAFDMHNRLRRDSASSRLSRNVTFIQTDLTEQQQRKFDLAGQRSAQVSAMKGPQKTLELPQIPEIMKRHDTTNQDVKGKLTFISKRNISLKPLVSDNDLEGAEKKKEGKGLLLKFKINTKNAKCKSNQTQVSPQADSTDLKSTNDNSQTTQQEQSKTEDLIVDSIDSDEPTTQLANIEVDLIDESTTDLLKNLKENLNADTMKYFKRYSDSPLEKRRKVDLTQRSSKDPAYSCLSGEHGPQKERVPVKRHQSEVLNVGAYVAPSTSAKSLPKKSPVTKKKSNKYILNLDQLPRKHSFQKKKSQFYHLQSQFTSTKIGEFKNLRVVERTDLPKDDMSSVAPWEDQEATNQSSRSSL